jgi:hypothetical protein
LVVPKSLAVDEFDGVDVDQIPLTDALRVVKDTLRRAHVADGVPIAPVDSIVVMKLIAGRSQDLADIEAIVSSGADRDVLWAAVGEKIPDRAHLLERLFANADSGR